MGDYWCKEDTKLVHFIGKDNIVFHCIIFPAMLKAHGNFVLPDNVPANEFLNIEGDKVSTSRNWAVWVHEYVKDFQGCEDVLRYVFVPMHRKQKTMILPGKISRTGTTVNWYPSLAIL